MKLLSQDDTIAAIATPSGYGGIGIVRISGADAYSIATQLIGRPLTPRHATFCHFRGRGDALIDEGIAIYFSAPGSYTGEDVIEVQIHGSPVVLDMLLARVLELGARSAEPGEFSRRAFLNNKRDLAQLSAISDLIHSASQQAARSAQRVLQGTFSKRIKEVCATIKELRAMLEVSLDFADEDVAIIGDDEIRATISKLAQKLRELERSTQQGTRLREGLELVIAGRPNVGKSSLLNRLARRETAIVSAQAGTTRDIVRSDILIDGVPVIVLDTAGIRPSDDAVEREGVRRTRAAMQRADIVLVLVDATQGITDTEQDLLEELCSTRSTMVVAYNKSDLLTAEQRSPNQEKLYISARSGEGINALCRVIKQQAGISESGEGTLVVSRRYCEQIGKACALLAEVSQKTLQSPEGVIHRDILAYELHTIHRLLFGMIGEYTTEDMLEDIFSQFCIGK